MMESNTNYRVYQDGLVVREDDFAERDSEFYQEFSLPPELITFIAESEVVC